MRTQIGLIAEMLQAVENEPTPLQKRLDQLGKMLGWVTLAICGVVFVVAIVRFTDLSLITAPNGGMLVYLKDAKQEIINLFMLSVGLAIAAVPEGLPAVVTISLALGMREMVKRHALIRKLSSVETLGSTTIICSDKTGTLTQNEMTLTHIWVDGRHLTITGSGHTLRGEFFEDGHQVSLDEHPGVQTALWVGALNNDAELTISGSVEDEQTYRMTGDPTEGALVVAAAKAGALPRPLNHAYPRIQEVPFDSERKRMITVHQIRESSPDDFSPFNHHETNGYVVAIKGAPDVVLDLCTHYQRMDDTQTPLTEEQRMRILNANDQMTQDALRVLGVAYRVSQSMPVMEDLEKLEEGMIFVGLAGMIDPPRPEVTPALAKASKANTHDRMTEVPEYSTGDYGDRSVENNHQVLSAVELDSFDDSSSR
jgi:Ca2+-transporting ATPase